MKSLRHQMLHLPKNPLCKACNESKCKYKHSRRLKGKEKGHGAEKFGDLITSDHWFSVGKRGAGHNKEKNIETIYDVGTDFLYSYPQCNKDTDNATKALLHFIGAEAHKTCKVFYSDRAGELIKACARVGINHQKSIPTRKQTNAVAERRNQQVQEGMRVTLANSGVPLCLWAVRSTILVYCTQCTS